MNESKTKPGFGFRHATPAAPGAIAVIDLIGDIDCALDRLEIRPVAVGQRSLRDLAGVDEGVVVRWSERHAQLLPHAGVFIVRTLIEKILAAGGVEEQRPDPNVVHPEADDECEALMLETLATTTSPAATDLLLNQPARWRAWDGEAPATSEVDRLSKHLNRLLTPPTVVAVGRPNVGKSTLTNAIALSSVSIVADLPGTTRDHVGVSITLPSTSGGVVVRWIDTPGRDEATSAFGPIDRAAADLAQSVIDSADLIVHCGDAAHGFLDPAELTLNPQTPILRVGVRCDLGEPEGCDVLTSALSGRGVDELADAVREALVPAAALEWNGPWRFHPSLKPAVAAPDSAIDS